MTDNYNKEDLILIGKISSAHGIKGQVKIDFYCEDPYSLESYNCIDIKNEEIKIKIGFIKRKQAICNIDQWTSREDAEKLVGTEIFILKADLPEPDEDEFYYSDLVGIKVIDITSKEPVGIVKTVQNYGSGDILEIEDINGKSNMYLFNKENFPTINISENIIESKLPVIDFHHDDKSEKLDEAKN